MQSENSRRGARLARLASLGRLWAILTLLVFLVPAPASLFAQEIPSSAAAIDALARDFRQCANNSGAAGLGGRELLHRAGKLQGEHVGPWPGPG